MKNTASLPTPQIGNMDLNALTKLIIAAAMKVHSALGPGLLESAYEACLAYELKDRGLLVERQKRQPVIYGDLTLDEGYRLDLLVEDRVIVELKALQELREVHTAQLLSYLRLAQRELGLLFNFHEAHLRDGIRRVINSRR